MKKQILILASMLSVLNVGLASAGLPPNNLWFTLESASGPGAYSVIESGPGHALVIEKEGDVTFRVGVNITSDIALAQWGISLNAFTSPTIGSPAYGFQNGQSHGSNYDLILSNSVNGSHNATFGRGSSDLSGSAGLIYSFDMPITGDASGNQVNVTGDFGVNEGILCSNGLYWWGFVGPNPYSVGAFAYADPPLDITPGWGSLSVIIIRTVPEPTTLGLIGLGIVLLARRKR